jgi:riboflavin kinase/FMN adenylyltransferase
VWVTSSTAKILTPTAIALGNFDGVHLGHQQVLQPILTSDALSASKSYATVVTFNPHPREFFSGESRQLLTPFPEKVEQLAKLGFEQLILLPFDRELASLSPQQFVEEVLLEKLQAKRISVGEDFRFGYRRAGTAEDLREIAAKFGVDVSITPLQTCSGEQESVRISSSRIRQALAEGNIAQANRMLGRTYSLTGTVIIGQQLGRTLGFPTANLQLDPAKLLPRHGVYCVRVILGENHSKIVNGVMNIGCRPTVEGNHPTVEVYLLDWSGDLYGQTLTACLEQFLRPEQKFPSLEALQAQIASDCDRARQIFTLPAFLTKKASGEAESLAQSEFDLD